MPTPKKPAAAAKLAAAPDNDRVIDLNAARAARAEAHGEPVILKSGDMTLVLPVEMPYAFARMGARGDLDGAIFCLIGDPQQADMFLSDPKLTVKDIEVLVSEANRIYGIDEGK